VVLTLAASWPTATLAAGSARGDGGDGRALGRRLLRLRRRIVEVLRLSATRGWTRLDLLEDATGLFLAGSGSPGCSCPTASPWARRSGGATRGDGGRGRRAGAATPRRAVPRPAVDHRRRPPRFWGWHPGSASCPGCSSIPPRQRDRLGRLLAALAVDPTLLAVGLDEDTALLVDGAATLEVRGGGAADGGRRGGGGPLRSSRATGDRPHARLRVDFLTVGCRRPAGAAGAPRSRHATVPAASRRRQDAARARQAQGE